MEILQRIGELVRAAEHVIDGDSSLWGVYVSWENLLNVSWPVPVAALRPLVPPALDLDVCQGSAWVSVVAFNACDARLAGKLPLPGASNFPELNFRTYVRLNGAPGVFFLSIDSPSRMAELLGRHLFDLPFQTSSISIAPSGDGFRVEMHRTGATLPDAAFVASYKPLGAPSTPAAGTLDDFLTNRLTMFLLRPDGALSRADIWHEPWRVQPCEVTIEANTVATAVGLTLPAQPPHAAFGPKTETIGYPPKPVTAAV